MINGTSNATIKTISGEILSQSIESGPADDGGGAGFHQNGAVEYSQADNTPGTSSGMVFTPSGEHLAIGTPQADRLPA